MRKRFTIFLLIIIFLVALTGTIWCLSSSQSARRLEPSAQTITITGESDTHKLITPAITNKQTPSYDPTSIITEEQSILPIPLSGPVSEARAEISGMDWYGDTLILLPQYPSRFGKGDGVLFGIQKSDIIAYLDGSLTTPLPVIEIPFSAPGIQQIAGYQGFEAIAFSGDHVFLTIESKPSDMLGYLIKGTIKPDLSELNLELASLIELIPPVQIENMTDEALLITPDRLLTFFEANGLNNNPKPLAYSFTLGGNPLGTMPMTNLEYRLTDVTELDKDGFFWAINYFYPGDTKLTTHTDPLVERYGEGVTHASSKAVERLVQLRYTSQGIMLTDTPPINLQLLGNDEARNWEAIARLDQRGFLLATDKFPTTIFAFVSFP